MKQITVRPRIPKPIWDLVCQGALPKGISSKEWLLEAIHEKAERQNLTNSLGQRLSDDHS